MIRAVLTSSRADSPRVRELLNELARPLPAVYKINRGRSGFYHVVSRAVELGAAYTVVVYSRRGNPSLVRFLDNRTGTWLPYALKLTGVKLLSDMGHVHVRQRKADKAIVVDRTGSFIGDVLTEVFGFPLLNAVPRGYRGVVIAVHDARGRDWRYEVSMYLDGFDKIYGPQLRVADMIYMYPRKALPDAASGGRRLTGGHV